MACGATLFCACHPEAAALACHDAAHFASSDTNDDEVEEEEGAHA